MMKKERKAILTSVPAQIRTQVREELKENHRRMILQTVFSTIVIAILYGLTELLGSEHTIPIGAVFLLLILIMLMEDVFNIIEDRERWGVPTSEEFDEIGDEII